MQALIKFGGNKVLFSVESVWADDRKAPWERIMIRDNTGRATRVVVAFTVRVLR